MKVKNFIAAALTALCFTAGVANTRNSNRMTTISDTKDRKILIAYYSRTNNTRQIAEQIRTLTGGDLFRIETQKDYPSDYQTTTEVAKKEKEANERPPLKATVDNQ